MDESAEIQDQRVTTQFGRWTDMGEWFKETCRIKESPSKAVETIPVPGKWHLGIHIPKGKAEGDYADAMETGINLLAAMGTRPENAYLEHGYCVILLKPAEFYEAKALAVQVRRWLVSNSFKTTVEGCRDSWRAGVIHLRFEQDTRNYAERVKERSKVKRLREKLTGSTANRTVVLTRGQVEALIDLVGEYETEQNNFSEDIKLYRLERYHIEEHEWQLEAEIRQILQPLAKLSEALGIALRPGTTDSRGPSS